MLPGEHDYQNFYSLTCIEKPNILLRFLYLFLLHFMHLDFRKTLSMYVNNVRMNILTKDYLNIWNFCVKLRTKVIFLAIHTNLNSHFNY